MTRWFAGIGAALATIIALSMGAAAQDYPNRTVKIIVPFPPGGTADADFVAFAKANPGVLNSATQGIGTTAHLTSELFQQMAGVKFQHIHYRGSAPAVQDLVAGNVDVAFDNIGAAGSLIRAGTIRALGVATEKPLASLPSVPTVKDTVPGFVVVTWVALVAPPKVPQPILNKLSAAIH